MRASHDTMIEPLFSEAFVRIFGRDESKGITRSLINAVLEAAEIEPIGEIEQISAEHSPMESSIECKSPRFDVQVVSERRMIDLEAQRYPEQIDNRAMLYAANMLVRGTGKIKSYADLPQAIVVVLLDDPSPFPEEEGFVHVCRWRWGMDDASTVDASDRQLIVLVELSKIHERYDKLDSDVLEDKLLSWTYLITNGFRDEGEVGTIMDSYPDIEEFAELYGLAVNDPKVVQAYWDAKSAVLEYNNRQEYFARREREGLERGLAEGRERGLAEGREKGLAEGRAEGLAEGREKGLAEGRAEGKASEREKFLAAMRASGIDETTIQAVLASADA